MGVTSGGVSQFQGTGTLPLVERAPTAQPGFASP